METEFKGTPAPWSLPHFADNSCSCDCGYILVEGHCGAVATVHYSKDNTFKNGDNPLLKQFIANALLIHCAPELLTALQGALKFIRHNHSGGNLPRGFEKWNEVVNKALGND